jgi:hypothetical protein
VHPVYLVGLGVLFISSFRDGLMNTAGWPGFTRWIGTFLV